MTYDFDYEYEALDDGGWKLCIDNASDEALREFAYRPGVKELVLNGDFVDHLALPDGVEWVYVEDLALKTLRVPDSVVHLHCPANRLRALDLPAGLETLVAHDNRLRALTFRGAPTALASLDVRNNRLAGLEFDVPPTLCHVEVEHSGLLWSTVGPSFKAFLTQYPLELGQGLHGWRSRHWP